MLSAGPARIPHPCGATDPAAWTSDLPAAYSASQATRNALATAADDFGNTFAQAKVIPAPARGELSQSGRIEQARDTDFFRVVAPVSGRMIVRQSAAAGSDLDPYLYAYGADRKLLVKNDDSGGMSDALVSFNVTAGATYYVRAAAYGTSTGAYTVQFGLGSDDFGNTFADAKAVALTSSGARIQAGKIDWAGDADVLRFVARVSGRMTITQTAAAQSGLDPFLNAYDAKQKLLAQNDDGDGTLNSSLRINVVKGQTYYVKVAGYGSTTGAYTLRLSTAASSVSQTSAQPAAQPTAQPVSTGQYNIELTISGMTGAQQQLVRRAAATWEQTIVGDVPNATYRGRSIDDLWVRITASSIDGIGGILGYASVDAMRGGSRLPYAGSITLDTADVADMQAKGALQGVIEHEIGHLLGIGTIWAARGLISGAGTSNPIFTGPRATAEYNAAYHQSARGVPVEAGGGSGTALGHWRESVFQTELMTGWYNYGQANPLSRITVASLADLGYQVNTAAASLLGTSGSSTATRTSAFRTPNHASRSLAWLPDAATSKKTAKQISAADQVFALEGWRI